MALGLDSQIGYAVETTAGTYETVNRFFEFVPPLGLRGMQNYQKSNGIRAGRSMAHAQALGTKWTEGTVTHELVAESFGLLLEACIEGTPATTGADPYEHVFEIGGSDLQSISAQWALPSTSANHPISAAGLRARSWTLNQPNPSSDIFPTFEVDWVGKPVDVDGTPSLASASYADFTRFTFAHAVLEVASSEICVDEFTITGTTGFDTEFKVCSTDPGAPTLHRPARPEVSGSFTTDLANLTQLGRYLAGTEAAFTVTYTNGASAILEFAGNVYFPGDMATVQDTGKTKETVQFEFLSGTSDAAALTVTLTNGDSAA